MRPQRGQPTRLPPSLGFSRQESSGEEPCYQKTKQKGGSSYVEKSCVETWSGRLRAAVCSGKGMHPTLQPTLRNPEGRDHRGQTPRSHFPYNLWSPSRVSNPPGSWWAREPINAVYTGQSPRGKDGVEEGRE